MHSLYIFFFFFFLGGYWISYFLAQHLPHTRITVVFLPRSEIPLTAATNKTEILECGECEFDKNPGGRFFSNKDHVGERE